MRLMQMIDRARAWWHDVERHRAVVDAQMACAFGEHGAVAIESHRMLDGTAVVARCTLCDAPLLDALRIVPDRFGVVHITNATPRDLVVHVNGGVHVLVTEAEQRRAQVLALRLLDT